MIMIVIMIMMTNMTTTMMTMMRVMRMMMTMKVMIMMMMMTSCAQHSRIPEMIRALRPQSKSSLSLNSVLLRLHNAVQLNWLLTDVLNIHILRQDPLPVKDLNKIVSPNP